METIDSKERLKEMESSGKYLFHGSPYPIEEFEPRQAYTEVKGELVPDGAPAVFASSEIETPIFRSIFHELNFQGLDGSYRIGFSNYENKTTFIHANQEAIEASRGNRGYVYVLERKYFKPRGNLEWTSEQNIFPFAIFNSSFENIGLPIITDEDFDGIEH